MNKELQEQLYREFPYLYSNRKRTMMQSLMCFGFMTDDGWFNIIRNLSMKLARLSPLTRASEVKEKFAQLRFYVDGATRAGMDAIQEAVEESRVTCERCSDVGSLRRNQDDGWMYTLCNRCWKNQKKRNKRRKG